MELLLILTGDDEFGEQGRKFPSFCRNCGIHWTPSGLVVPPVETRPRPTNVGGSGMQLECEPATWLKHFRVSVDLLPSLPPEHPVTVCVCKR